LKTLDICLLQGDVQRHFSLPNTAAGRAEVLALLAETPVELLVPEASGGYEAALFEALQHAKIPVVRLQPRRPRPFARADGQRAKTDRIDARIPALSGQRMQPAPNAIEPDNQRYIKALTSRRRFLVARRCAGRCQLKQAVFEDICAMTRRAAKLYSRCPLSCM